MRVDLFDFHLPKDRIATHPARPRESARLLHVKDDGLSDLYISDIVNLLKPKDVLVVNDTKVIPARLFGIKTSDVSGVMPASAGMTKTIEILLHKDLGDGRWQVFARPAKKLKAGDSLSFVMPAEAGIQEQSGSSFCGKDALTAIVLDKLPSGEVILRFNKKGNELKAEIATYGEPPLPPYIDRPDGATAQDKEDYQTCYAAHDGSVAAPTAGLHFTPALLAAIQARGVAVEKVTLHVGAGTFQPVKAEDTDDHAMHSEWGEVSAETAARLNRVRAAGGRIIAVGTTSLRLLESAADEEGTLHPFGAETDIFITPGYRFRAVDCLMTNFHLPKSTLFMLVCAFAGMERMKAAYGHAIAHGYRFYSYGDACFLEKA